MHCRSDLIRGFLFMLCIGWASAAQAQLLFEADAVALQRNNSGNASFISGPDSVSANSGGYNFEPGYRLMFGGILDKWQVDTTFTQISPWSSSQSGTFSAPVVFDDNAGNGNVVTTPPGNTLTFPGVLRNASLSSLAGADQSTQGEFLQAGSSFFTQTTSNYRDWEVNIGTSQVYHPWRLSAGWRNINFTERTMLQMGGVFDAATTNGLGVSSGLGDPAITNAGGQLISGTADGFDSIASGNGTDSLLYSVNSSTTNMLNGAQLTFAYRVYEGSWLALDAYSKAGIFRNQMTGRVTETMAGSGNDDSVYQRTLAANRIGAAFAGNLGLRAVIGLTDYINLVAGYEVLFLSGLALGPDQFNGVGSDVTGASVYRVQNHGNVIANGGTLGLQILW